MNKLQKRKVREIKRRIAIEKNNENPVSFKKAKKINKRIQKSVKEYEEAFNKYLNSKFR